MSYYIKVRYINTLTFYLYIIAECDIKLHTSWTLSDGEMRLAANFHVHGVGANVEQELISRFDSYITLLSFSWALLPEALMR